MGGCAAKPSVDHEDAAPADPDDGEVLVLDYPTEGARLFQLNELVRATGRFDEAAVLGEGGFGKVYKGVVNVGGGKKQLIAVKRLDPSSFQGATEWLAEVLLLGNLQHPNLVRLVGYSTEGDEDRCLVYEYMDKGSLDYWLYEEEEGNGKDFAPLSWQLRVKILLEAAHGLAYLHSMNIIHRDLKTSNILLDNNFLAKLTDFGLATKRAEGKTHKSTRVMGTRGYLDPRFIETGHLTPKTDVYAFGMIILELMTGRRPADQEGKQSCMEAMLPFFELRKPDLTPAMDRHLQEQFSLAAAQKLLILAKHCVNEDPVERPQVEDLLLPLSSIYEMSSVPAEEAPGLH